jgi:hypothetical protein
VPVRRPARRGRHGVASGFIKLEAAPTLFRRARVNLNLVPASKSLSMALLDSPVKMLLPLYNRKDEALLDPPGGFK